MRRVPQTPARWRVEARSRFTDLQTTLEFDIPFGSQDFMSDHISRAINTYYPNNSAIVDSARWLNEHLFEGLLDDNGRLRPGVNAQTRDAPRPKEMVRGDLGSGGEPGKPR